MPSNPLILLFSCFTVFCVDALASESVASIAKKTAAIDAATSFSESQIALITGTDRGGTVEALKDAKTTQKVTVTIGLSNRIAKLAFYVENGNPICVHAWSEHFDWDEKSGEFSSARSSVKDESWIYFSGDKIVGLKGINQEVAETNAANSLAIFWAVFKGIQSDAAEIDIESLLKSGS